MAGAGPGQQPELRTQLKGMLLRLGLPVAAVWVVGLLIAGFSISPTVQWVGIGVPAFVTLLAAVLVAWALRQARKAKGVAGILSNVQTAEDRQAALEKLEGTYKKSDGLGQGAREGRPGGGFRFTEPAREAGSAHVGTGVHESADERAVIPQPADGRNV